MGLEVRERMVDFQPRTEFDGYKIERLLGKGGMGAVYLATDTLLQRRVAIKFIFADEDATAQQRFLIEARAIARLQHPNVVAIYRVGELDGYPYLVSEFIRGTPLNEIARPITYNMALNLGIGISCALSAAHQKGVLHRDLKPANAILSNDGTVKLLDFGVAKMVRLGADSSSSSVPPLDGVAVTAGTGDGQMVSIDETIKVAVESDYRHIFGSQLTESNIIMGTPHFMAPELWTGAPASFQSDIYGFGMLIYTLLCEHSPYKGTNVEAIRHSIMNHGPPPLHEVAPHVEKKFSEIIDRCLNRNQNQRFSSINDVRKQLEHLAGDKTEEAIPEGNPYRGLNAFDISHRPLFFGRDSETRLILERLVADPFVLVTGDSGVGKLSLCRAGILSRIPTWRENNRSWRVVNLVPGRSPIRELGEALAQVFDASREAIIDALSVDPGGVARDLRAVQGEDRGLFIFIDQFEEFVTVSDPDEIEEAMMFLSWLVIPSDCIRLLATVRGDCLSRLAGLPHIGDKLSKGLFFLRALSEDRLEEVIVQPAQMRGVSFESPKLVRRLVDETMKVDGSLPLLQFALVELWEGRDRSTHTISLASLNKIGDFAGILGRHADSVFNDMQPLERAAAKAVLLSLITPEKTVVRRSLDELNIDSKLERTAVDTLVRGGLLAVRNTADGDTYTLAHEAIINAWPMMCGWFSSGAESHWILERLSHASRRWHREGKRSEHLWHRCELQELQWISPTKLGKTEQLFLDESRAAVRCAVFKRLILVILIPLVIILFFGGMILRTHSQLSHDIATALGDARALEGKIEMFENEASRQRADALALFDGADFEQAEEAWQRYRARQKMVMPLQRQIGQILEEALLLDSEREDVRQMYANHLYERALAARERGELDEAMGFVDRLALYDENGTLEEKWRSPVQVTIRVVPSSATLTVFDVNRDRYTAKPSKRVHVGHWQHAPITVPPGAYVAQFDAPGRVRVRYPFVVNQDNLEIVLSLPHADAVPDGFVYIAPGTFLYGSDAAQRQHAMRTVLLHEAHTDGYLIAKHETTFSQWLEYLNALPVAQRADRLPRVAPAKQPGALAIRQDEGGRWHIAFQLTLMRHGAPEHAPLIFRGRKHRTEQDWLKLPVVGVSAVDATHYAIWLHESGKVPGARLCTEKEWERGARGSDGRVYPHGENLAPDEANIVGTYGYRIDAAAPDEVGTHPASNSPFGLSDMAGNVWEWTRSAFNEKKYAIRGGSFLTGAYAAKTTGRIERHSGHRDISTGFRICADLQSK